MPAAICFESTTQRSTIHIKYAAHKIIISGKLIPPNAINAKVHQYSVYNIYTVYIIKYTTNKQRNRITKDGNITVGAKVSNGIKCRDPDLLSLAVTRNERFQIGSLKAS